MRDQFPTAIGLAAKNSNPFVPAGIPRQNAYSYATLYLRLLLLFRLLSLKGRRHQLAAFLFSARLTAVSLESAKDVRFTSKVPGKALL
jgi:hypothetical protein